MGKSTIACTNGVPWTKVLCRGFLAVAISPNLSSNLWIEPFHASFPSSGLLFRATDRVEFSSWDLSLRAVGRYWAEPSLRSDGHWEFLDAILGGLLFLLGPNRSKGYTLLNLSIALVLSGARLTFRWELLARTDEVRPGWYEGSLDLSVWYKSVRLDWETSGNNVRLVLEEGKWVFILTLCCPDWIGTPP